MIRKTQHTGFLIFLSLVLITSCGTRGDKVEFETSSGEPIIRIMPLGNSITYGNYHPEQRPEGLITGYRQSLWLMLRKAGYNVDFVGSRTTGADAEPSFDPDNEGYPGWTDDQIEEHVYKWLKKNPPDIILLHIGTNGLDPDPSDVEGILDEIDRFEHDFDQPVKVILAKIINRSTYSQLTTQFNQNIEKMALDRIFTEGDDIEVIDMEFETNIDYRLNTSGGEMFDNLHPFEGGHEKMALRWFKALQEVLPEPEQPAVRDQSPADHTNTGELFTASETYDGRVQKSLIVLYNFKEGSGNRVPDGSGVGVPMDLYINELNSTTWDADQGLEVTRESILIPSDMNRKLIDSCMATNEISLEAWIRTGYTEQDGPANIIRISDPLDKGIELSQEFEYGDRSSYFFTVSVNTGISGEDASPILSTSDHFDAISLQHLVFTRNVNGTETFYVDGLETGIKSTGGDFSSWTQHTLKLSLCNSLDFENEWKGKLFLAAIYNRALTATEVRQNFQAGFGTQDSKIKLPVKPEKLESTALSSIAAELRWGNRGDEVTGYVIERKLAGGTFTHVESVPYPATGYVDENLKPGATYHYRIKSLNDLGESPYTAETIVTTKSDASLSNVALGKKAPQSSTTYKGKASRGVDGNTSGVYADNSVTHTAYELNAWWEVDLGGTFYIDYIDVWNRTDLCCIDRMARFYIFISQDPFESHDFQTTKDQPGVRSVYHEFFPDPKASFNVAANGRYVRIQLSDSQNICLAEMVVMGKEP